MNTFGLFNYLKRIKKLNIMQIWDEVIKEYLTVILINIGTLVTAFSQNSDSRIILTE